MVAAWLNREDNVLYAQNSSSEMIAAWLNREDSSMHEIAASRS